MNDAPLAPVGPATANLTRTLAVGPQFHLDRAVLEDPVWRMALVSEYLGAQEDEGRLSKGKWLAASIFAAVGLLLSTWASPTSALATVPCLLAVLALLWRQSHQRRRLPSVPEAFSRYFDRAIFNAGAKWQRMSFAQKRAFLAADLDSYAHALHELPQRAQP